MIDHNEWVQRKNRKVMGIKYSVAMNFCYVVMAATLVLIESWGGDDSYLNLIIFLITFILLLQILLCLQ